jgi:hypothetical protein
MRPWMKRIAIALLFALLMAIGMLGAYLDLLYGPSG